MARYEVVGAGSRVVSRARSNIHDTTTRWGTVRGTVEATAETLADEGARAEIAVDMTEFDAGDFLRNRKIKKDLEVKRYPEARFELSALEDVERRDDGSFAARARGILSWRGHQADIVASGRGRLGPETLEAEASFDLDVTELGITPPRFLMFKVESVVTIDVTITARASSSHVP